MNLIGFIKKVTGIATVEELKEAKALHDSGVQRQKEVQDAVIERTRTVTQRINELSESTHRATKVG